MFAIVTPLQHGVSIQKKIRVVLKAGMPEIRNAGMAECRKSRPGNPKTRNDFSRMPKS